MSFPLRSASLAPLALLFCLSGCSDAPPVDLTQYPALGGPEAMPDLSRVDPFEASYQSGAESVEVVVSRDRVDPELLSFASTLLFSDGRAFTDRATWAVSSGLPVRTVSPIQGGAGELTLEYSGPVVSGSSTSDGGTEQIDCRLEAAPSSGVGLAVLLATLPLEIGTRVRVPIMRRSDCSILWIPFEVNGSDSFELPDGSVVSTFVVDGERFGTYWLADTPPYVLRRDMRSGNQQILSDFVVR